MEYEKLRPTDITRHILKIFDKYHLEELTVEVVHALILQIHELLETYDHHKMGDILGFNISNEVGKVIELFKEDEKENKSNSGKNKKVKKN
jgi:hypothetical protein